ncbi:MAG TPA: YggS family pyridoxal phosphate-dependent enzyme [Bacillota bacterium]|nr:YggS family pyridoxal phosphate-dependent enzyme [Bacillota bacterium]
MSIQQNLLSVRDMIGEAALRAGRDSASIGLVAVTKTQSVENIQMVVEQGVSDLGENRVQELLDKYPQIKGPVRWHLIGSLQTNKVRQIVDKVFLIHSVDRWALAEEIDLRARQHGLVSQILVQVNVSGEESKHGISPEDTPEFVRSLAGLPNLRVCGLMTMAPFYAEPETTRSVFTGLRKLAGEIDRLAIQGVSMEWLSMGMSNDYQVAIEEGATLVRIGSDIFNPRS